MSRLKGKVAIVTGAGRGIGRATALRFAEEGATVVVADVDRENAANVATEAQGHGTATHAHLDAGDEDSWRALLDTVAREHGRLDVLVNNAASRVPATIDETDLELWRRNQRVNSEGTYLGTKLGAEAMTEGGAIVNIASVAAFVAVPESFPYSAAKGSVVALTRTAAVHFARQNRGIRVNAVAPGTTFTETISEQLATIAAKPGGPSVEESLQRLGAKVPLGRWAEPREIANAILFLASDEASYVTGQCLLVDGGQTSV
ncbi:SDR family NAD(P)-dependent oxidoreductase [Georgenia sp. AZ-5]|uniref:SDR family NAD(P)-dependent oxidoreductase n=1 Tax=Georgenia sp. AZ-5 TaxID=3367526 RepID=UPI003754C083